MSVTFPSNIGSGIGKMPKNWGIQDLLKTIKVADGAKAAVSALGTAIEKVRKSLWITGGKDPFKGKNRLFGSGSKGRGAYIANRTALKKSLDEIMYHSMLHSLIYENKSWDAPGFIPKRAGPLDVLDESSPGLEKMIKETIATNEAITAVESFMKNKNDPYDELGEFIKSSVIAEIDPFADLLGVTSNLGGLASGVGKPLKEMIGEEEGNPLDAMGLTSDLGGLASTTNAGNYAARKANTTLYGQQSRTAIEEPLNELGKTIINAANTVANIAGTIGSSVGVLGSKIGQGFKTQILQGGALRVLPKIATLFEKGIGLPFKLFGAVVKAPFKLFSSIANLPWKKIGKEIKGLGEAGLAIFAKGALAPFGILKNVLQGLGGMLSVGFVPMITSIVGLMLQLQPAISQVATWMQQLWTILEMIFNGSAAGELLLTTLFQNILTQVATWINQLVGIIATALPGIINVIVALVPSIFNAITNSLPIILSAVKNVITGLLQAVLAILPSLLETILSLIPMVINLLVEAFPILIGVIIDLVPTIIDILVTNIPMIIESIFGAIPMIVEAIFGALPAILTAIMMATPLILDMIFTKALPALLVGIWEAVKALAVGFFNAFVESFNNIGEKIRDAFSKTPDDVSEGIVSGMADLLEPTYITVK